MAATMDARSIVEYLTVDFSAEGKKTCRECLRSKTLPCERVLTLTKSYQLQDSSILEAHSLVMQNLITMSSPAVPSISSLSYMNTMATAIRFAQLLLYLPSTKTLKAKQEQAISHQTSTALQTQLKASAVALSDVVDKAIHGLLDNMVKSVLKLLESSQSSIDHDSDPMILDASTSQGDLRPLMCFCFQSILRLHQFCKRKQQWMIPLTKALCDLANACHKRDASLPTSLLEDAIRTMTKMLEEGTMILANHMTSTPAVLPSSQHTFFAKFLSFLVARVVTLVLLLPDDYSTKDMDVSISPLWKILITLRGMPELILVSGIPQSSSNEHMGDFLQSFSEIASKIEKQMLKVLWREAKGQRAPTTLHLSSLRMLTQMKAKPVKAMSNPSSQWILRNSRMLGRLQMLHAVIQRATLGTIGPLTMEDIEALLKLCETHFSTVLPHCFGILAASMYRTPTKATSSSSRSLCLKDCIFAMVKLLTRTERALSLHDASKQSQFHRLLIQWMSPMRHEKSKEPGVTHGYKMHPITQEFVLSVIYAYILSHGGAMPPLVSLMIKILFDSRTTPMLRSNIACVLVRLQRTHKLGGWKSDISRLLENEFAEIWKVYSASCGRRKASERKRKRSNPCANIVSIHHYTSHDVEAIGQVLAQLSTHRSSLLTGTMESMIDDHAWKQIGEKKKATHLKAISLLLWYIQGILSSTSSPSLSNDRKISLLSGLLEYVISQLTVTVTIPKKEQDFLDHIPLFIVTLSLCQQLNDTAKQEASVVTPAMCQFMAACTSKSLLQPMQRNCTPDRRQCAVLNRRLLLGGIALLGSMAPASTVSCPNQVLEMVREAFVRVFASHDMTILSPTLSALIKFGQTIATTHARYLPRFLPTERIPMFQARGQGMIWKNGAHLGIDNGTNSFLELCSNLEHLIQQRNIENSIFPQLSSYHIAIGSYFLQMPTQGGRQAIVIFPPGEQSLKDIRHMYELQDGDELTQVQSLKRIVVSKLEGEGCHFLLSK